jgi:DNA-binding transcriptional LysR family regulator
MSRCRPALPAAHPLAQCAEEPLALGDLAREQFVLYRRPEGPGLYDAIPGACRAADFSPIIIQEAPRVPATLSLVAAGIGISIVPASMRRLGGEDIAYRALTGRPVCRRQSTWRCGAPLSPGLTRFRPVVQRAKAAHTGAIAG